MLQLLMDGGEFQLDEILPFQYGIGYCYNSNIIARSKRGKFFEYV